VTEVGIGSLPESLHEKLSSLRFSLVASMSSIGAVGDTLRRLKAAVGDTLRRLKAAGEVPREYRHMAQWVGDRVMSGLQAV
jgi:hypothetical protein